MVNLLVDSQAAEKSSKVTYFDLNFGGGNLSLTKLGGLKIMLVE